MNNPSSLQDESYQTGSLDKTLKRLRNVALFMYLPDDVLQELSLHAERLEFPLDAVLVNKGDPGDAMYLLRSGWVKFIAPEAEGKEVVLNHCGPGEAIGDVALVDGEPWDATVIALMPVGVLRVWRKDLLKILKERPELGLDLMRGLAARIRTSSSYVEKSIEWYNAIAKGDYSVTLKRVGDEHTTVLTRNRPDDTRVGEYLASFMSMVETVQQREESLKKEIQELRIKVDETRVSAEVNELTESSFFKDLKSAKDRWQKQRKK